MEKEIVSNEKKQKKPLLFKFGIGLLIIYVLLWASALIIPFTSLSTQIKAISNRRNSIFNRCRLCWQRSGGKV